MKTLTRLPIISIVALLLGMMLLTEFYTHLALGHFTQIGFANAIHSVAHLDNAPLFWKQVLLWAADHSAVFAPLAASTLALTSLLLILLILRTLFLWIATFIFLFYWVSLWAYPGIWIFEFLFPLAFAFCAASASLREGILGSSLFGTFKWPWRFGIVLFSVVFLWYVIFLGKNAGELTSRVAWQTAITFAILFGINAFIKRKENPKETKWVDGMVLIIGAMMVLQIFADQAVGFYNAQGYAELVSSYAQESSAAGWYKDFLSWTADNAVLFMPLQAFFEVGVAALLVLLIFRGPVLFLTALMFALFTYAEFGVKAELPSSPIHTLTNTWELLFVTCVAFFISFKRTAELFQAPTWKEKILGKPLYGHFHLYFKLGIATLGGLALFGAGMVTHVFQEDYVTTSRLGGLVFGLLLAVRAFIDHRCSCDPQSALKRASRPQLDR